MSQAPPLDESERAKLEGRARKLAQEKAYLQLVNQLMARISALPGLENLLDNMLQSIVDIIGGTNVMLYYWVDGQLHYADVYGERRQPEAIDDAYVRQVLDTGTPLELEHDVADSQILNPALASAWTWIYPLRVGDEPVGVLKIDNLHVGTREMRQFLPNFFNYAAAVLKNDIFGHTQLKRAYDELKRLNASLAVARDAAEAASRAKSAFLANMSHELRTPLNAILGFAQLMVRENPLDQDGCRRLHAIEHSGQHLMELINDILELSRVEAGHLTLRVEPFDLRALAATVAEMVQLRAQAKGLAVECVCAADIPPRVEGDSHHLRQVLINLLNNAVKYTDRGDVRLSIGWDGRQALFEVTDTGQGISPDDLDKIFDPFYQTATGAAKGEGSGLGLAISRDYVRLMGGELAVESRVGQGSRFHFGLPLRTVEPAGEDTAISQKVLGLALDQPVWRVLVADDDESSRLCLVQLLEQAGFEAQQAANGEEAVDLFRIWHPHFIWLDRHMPVMDGLEALGRIRALPGGQKTPIVLLTATLFEDSPEAVAVPGSDGLLRKPFQAEQVFETMRQRLGLRYRYAEEPPAVAAATELGPDPAGVARLDGGLRLALRRAADVLDVEAARRIVEDIALQDPALARGLGQLLDNYRFDQIAALLDDGRPASG